MNTIFQIMAISESEKSQFRQRIEWTGHERRRDVTDLANGKPFHATLIVTN